ncbi:MAG: PilZ domain-containing protein [Deltaproteobacteria bacterium]|nr:PilZ domain-containing protein [Deltaproteobacteria bacterium]
MSEERRNTKRYALGVWAEVQSGDKETPRYLITRDMNAKGAYFYAIDPVAQGALISVKFMFKNDPFEDLTGAKSDILFSGTVVRCEDRGIAVNFKRHEMFPVAAVEVL